MAGNRVTRYVVVDTRRSGTRGRFMTVAVLDDLVQLDGIRRLDGRPVQTRRSLYTRHPIRYLDAFRHGRSVRFAVYASLPRWPSARGAGSVRLLAGLIKEASYRGAWSRASFGISKSADPTWIVIRPDTQTSDDMLHAFFSTDSSSELARLRTCWDEPRAPYPLASYTLARHVDLGHEPHMEPVSCHVYQRSVA